MSDAPKGPSTKPPPPAFADTSESEVRIALAARATTAMRPLPPLKSRPRVIMEAEAIGWIDLSPAARALLDRLDGQSTVLDLAEGTDAQVEAVFDALTELERASVIDFQE
jgi:predicted transcriptional regulator